MCLLVLYIDFALMFNDVHWSWTKMHEGPGTTIVHDVQWKCTTVQRCSSILYWFYRHLSVLVLLDPQISAAKGVFEKKYTIKLQPISRGTTFSREREASNAQTAINVIGKCAGANGHPPETSIPPLKLQREPLQRNRCLGKNSNWYKTNARCCRHRCERACAGTPR